MLAKMAKSIITDLNRIFNSGVTAVVPENLIRKSVQYNNGTQELEISGQSINLQNKNVYLVGVGKAVQNMSKEVEGILGDKIKKGIISIPVGSLANKTVNENVSYYEGAKHNLPDTNAETSAKKITDLVTNLGANDLLLVLISGGGSALLPLPKPPITLEEKTTLIKKLANSGADIQELNTVRKRLSDLKGGQLAIKAYPAQVVSLVLSDIVEDPLDLIASGPTTENKDNFTKPIDIIKKYNLYDSLPDSVTTVLRNYGVTEPFPKENVNNYIIGSNKNSIAAAIKEAQSLNYLALDLSNSVTGNIKTIAGSYAKLTKEFCLYLNGQLSSEILKQNILNLNIPGLNANCLEKNNVNKEICLILGGEITVEVKGNGKGGRNQQLALEYSNIIHECGEELNDFDVYFLSAGTDGIDGPTDAAGAIGYLNLITDAEKDNIDVNRYLNENDSYNFYKQFKNGMFHVITGHTNTNVMDLHIILIRRNK